MATQRQVVTIQCPSCGRTLPPTVLKCHFCGGDLAFVARPEFKPSEKVLSPEEQRQDKLYRIVACYWIFDGICAMLVSFNLLPQWASGIGGMLFSYLGLALTTGFLISILGVGMLMKVPLARWLVGAFCWFRVIIGLLGIGVVLRTGDFEMAKHNIYLMAFLNLVDTVFAGFQIWLLNVTDYEVLN